ncbi:MAG: hypothetical protein IMF19_07240 [Proteobacteria bacterium]|nr:hypothetical protein [Pseudomonadota bacterium]
MSNEGKATDRKRDGWMDKLRRLCGSKLRMEDRGRDLSKRDGFGDWLRDIRRASGRI